jgi:phytoene dehydrogenase-like protein
MVSVIEAHQGRVMLRTRIKRILTEHGRVAGVETVTGRIHRAPIVVANGDVVTMLTQLVASTDLPPDYAGQLVDLRRGPSALLLSLGLDVLPDLPARIFVHRNGMRFGIGNPSVIDSTLAPPGHAALTILQLLSEADAESWHRKEGDYRLRKEAAGDRLIDAIEAAAIPGLRGHIVHREVASPPSFTLFARTRHGNIYGAARDQQLPQIKTPLPGLMLVGAGTPTGPGIEAVVVSGTVAANLIAPPPPKDE